VFTCTINAVLRYLYMRPYEQAGWYQDVFDTYMDAWKSSIKLHVKNRPEDEQLDVRNMSKTLKLKHSCKKCAFCWYLLHMCITLHGSNNVKWASSLKLTTARTILRQCCITPCHKYTRVNAYSRIRVAALECTNTGCVCQLLSCVTKTSSGRHGKLPRRNQYNSKAGH